MTVPADNNVRLAYTGSGTTGPFTTPFFLANADIRAVKVLISDGTETDLALDTDFTLTGAGDESGGSLTLTASLSSSYRLVIINDAVDSQEASYPRNDPFPAETHEAVVDRRTMVSQRHGDRLDRTLRQPDGDSADIDEIPAKVERASKFLVFDADGDPQVSSGTGSDSGLRTDLATTGSTTGSTLIAAYDPLAPTYLKTLSDILNGDQVSFFRFIDKSKHAAIQARTSTDDISDDFEVALNALMDADNSGGLYIPRGTFLHNESKTYGNTADTDDSPIVIRGEGNASIIKTTDASVTPITIQGPTPDTDSAGNRFTGRSLIEKLAFLGPAFWGGSKSGTAVKWYGAQGETMRDVWILGWDTGVFLQNVDLLAFDQAWIEHNNKGIDSAASGYALSGSGQMNSFKMLGGQIGNNSTHGVKYYGGLAPVFSGVNFTTNGNSLILSPTDIAGSPVTECPLILGCYFEKDTSNTIVIGGGTGIVRDPIIQGGTIIANAAAAAILVSNAGSLGVGARGRINISISLSGSATAIDQTSSSTKIDYQNLNGTPIGDVTPAAVDGTTVAAATSFNSKAVPSSNWGFNFAPGTAIAVAASASYSFATGSGLVIVHDDSNGSAAAFLCYAGVVTKLGGASDIVSGAPGVSETGVEYDAGSDKYKITNGYAASHNYYFGLIKTRQNS